MWVIDFLLLLCLTVITLSRRKELVNPLSVSVTQLLLTLAPICRWHRDLLWICRWKHSICWYLSAVFFFCKRPYTEILVSVSHCPRQWTALLFICNTMWFSPTDGWFPDCREFWTSVQHSQWLGTISPRSSHLWRTKLIFRIASTMSRSNTSMLPWYEIHCLIPIFADCFRIRSCYTGSSVSHFRSITSVWKSGPVRFFGHQSLRLGPRPVHIYHTVPQTGPNWYGPVLSGFLRS